MSTPGRPTIDQQVTFFFTEDLAATSVFYEEILGLPLVLDQGSCRIYEVCVNAFVGFCQRAQSPYEDTVIFTLVTRDVDGWHAFLLQSGVEIEKPPTRNAVYNVYQCFVRDPNGYLIEIQTFLDPRWPEPDL